MSAHEIIASKLFEDAKSSVSLAFGKNIEGFPVVEDLAGLPHMLVAGTTGSGKSVALNSMSDEYPLQSNS